MVKPGALTLTTLVLFIITTCVNGYGRMVGGRTEVKDVKTNKQVQELGKFSVEEFNRSQNGHGKLIFSQVVEAQKQVVAGIKYYLTIEAIENQELHIFNSVVMIKPWLRSKELLNFAPSGRLWSEAIIFENS